MDIANVAQKFHRIVSSLDFVPRRVILHRNLTESCQVWTLEVEWLVLHKHLTKVCQIWTLEPER